MVHMSLCKKSNVTYSPNDILGEEEWCTNIKDVYEEGPCPSPPQQMELSGMHTIQVIF